MSIPQQLNHYRILSPLGKGGMGEVYLAEDTRLHRRVAVKVLSKLMAGDPERRQRFEREAQAVAALNHPNIVTIHSVEEADGVPFLTMELVEGRPLSDLITSGGMGVDALLRIGIAVADAIAAAHQRGITHRDLKPANILVTHDGRVKVLDFGLAKLRESHADAAADDLTRMPTSDLTGEGRIIGTVAYMSPEQAEGKPIDPRTDIFSLGVVLHEMATGERPFKGDTNVSVISSILKDTPSAVTDINPSLPPGLAKVIRRSMAKDPSRRYQTATDLRNELEELKQEIDSGITMTMSGPHVVGRRDRRAPSKRTAITAGVALLVVLAGALLLWRPWTGAVVPARVEIDRLSRLTASGTASLAAISPDGRYVVHVKTEAGQRSLWIRQTATTSDVQIVPPGPARYDGVTYSPDGDYVYYVTYEPNGGIGTLYRVAVLGGTPHRVLEDVDSRISFSPDRSEFAFTRGAPAQGTAWVMVASADGRNVRPLAQLDRPDQFSLNGPAWSPDGRTIIAAAQILRPSLHWAFLAVDVATGRTTAVGGQWNAAVEAEWLPDGRSFIAVATEYGYGVSQLWQVSYPGGERWRLTNDLSTYSTISLSADARALATVQQEIAANLFVGAPGELSSPTQLTRGSGRADGLTGIAWHPDGRIVFGSAGTDRPQLWIVDSSGGNLRQLTTQDDPSFLPRVTPDGQWIVFHRFSDGMMRIWRMRPDGSDQRALTSTGVATNPVPAPDGMIYFTQVATGSPRPFKIPVDGGEPVPLADANFRAVDISPDGSSLLGVVWDAERQRSATGILPVSGGEVRLLRDVPPNGTAWGPGGRTITFGEVSAEGPRLMRYDLASGKVEPLATMADNDVFNYAWSSDFQRIAFARGRATSDVLLMALRPGGER